MNFHIIFIIQYMLLYDPDKITVLNFQQDYYSGNTILNHSLLLPAITFESTLVSCYVRRASLPGLTLWEIAGDYSSYKYLAINHAGFINRSIPYFDEGVKEIQRVYSGHLPQAINEQTGQFIGGWLKKLRVWRASKPTTD
jgi:hypothetical protein